MKYWKIVKQSAVKFFEDDSMTYSASIAFYTIFSLPAIFIITITIAGSLYNDQVVRETLLEQIQSLSGPESAAIAQKIMANASVLGSSVMAKVVGIATLIFSATTVFVSMQTGLNKIWGVKPKPDQEIWNFFISRLLSLAMVVSIGFLMLVSLIADTLIVVFNNVLTQLLSGAAIYIISVANLAVSLLVITLVFAMIFKILPDADIQWQDVWVGAGVTTVLFTLGKYLIGFYLGNSTISSAYGAAGSLVLLLLWVYYSTVILMFGAEFTYVYAKEAGHTVLAEEQAVAVEVNEKETDLID